MGHRAQLLIVDDETSNLARLRQILSDEYRLVFARSGTEALAAAQKHHPALILLDVQMPDMDGYSVCRQLKAAESTRDIPVLFVTSRGEVGDEAAGFDAGAVDYLIKPIVPQIVKARVHTHLSLVRADQLEASYRDAIYMLGDAGHYNDTDTGAHIWRMAAYARLLATAAGWGRDASELLELAAPMHDTGKIGILDTILRKPGKLNDEEWEVMKTHTMIGHKILSKSHAPLFQLAAEVALSHHEKWDGTGYPQGLVGEAIPESARIVALADVFDALSMKRPYKAAWPLEQVLAEIQRLSGSHFEPRLVDLFVQILPCVLETQSRWNQDPPLRAPVDCEQLRRS